MTKLKMHDPETIEQAIKHVMKVKNVSRERAVQAYLAYVKRETRKEVDNMDIPELNKFFF